MSDLRDHLFAALEELSDPDNKDLDQSIKRAKAIGEVSGRIIDSAKVEVDMVNALANSGHDPSTFFEVQDRLLEEPKTEGTETGLRPPLRRMA